LRTDLALWSAPRAPVAADVPGRRTGADDFTDADYVPAATYLKPLKGALQASRVPGRILTTAPVQAAEVSRLPIGVGLYAAVFSLREPPASRLSVYA